MWVLEKLTDKVTVQYLIAEKKCYIFGRKNADIILDDCSISRKHCIINVATRTHCPFTVETLTGVWVIDKKSKYGTYVYENNNWMRLVEEQFKQLSNGSIIRFGLMQNIWRLCYIPLFACASKLSVEQTEKIKAQLTAVDGQFLTKWTNKCTVVFVNNITLTKKNLLALIRGVPIVTTKYLTQVIENVKRNEPLPDYKQFKPEIVESTLIPHLVSLNTEDNRRELFKGKTFIIPRREQLVDLQEIIESAGGSIELLKLDGNWRKLANENTIVVNLPCDKIINPDRNAQAFKNLTKVLKNEYNARVIPESEIYLAVAYSSTEKYCNPKSQIFELRLSSYNQNSVGCIIEEETPSLSQNERTFQKPIIDAGVNKSEQLLTSISKDNKLLRKRNHSPELEENSKRSASDKYELNINSILHSNENNSICESSKDEVKTVEEVSSKNESSNYSGNVKETKSKAIGVRQGVRDNLNKKRKNLNKKLDDFWGYVSKECPPEESTKRRLSLDFIEENQCKPPEKKKCTGIENQSSKTTNSVQEMSTETLHDRVPFSSSSSTNKKTAEGPECNISVDGQGELKWYRVKNLPRQDPNTEFKILATPQRRVLKKCTPAEPMVKKLTKEEEEKIRKMLLAQGWRTIRRHENQKNHNLYDE